MKTITEFSGFTINQALQARAKLAAEGVAEDQQAEQLGAAVSVSGDRLARLVEALGAIGDHPERVRLVRVFAGTDEVKGAKKVGEFNYLVDLQPSGGAGGKGGRDRDRGRGRGDRGDRGKGGGGGGVRGPGRPGGPGGLEKEPPRGSTPSSGVGWMLSRAPAAPGEDRGRRGGKPGGKGRPFGKGRPGGGPGRPGGGPGRPGGGGPGRPGGGPGRPGGGPGRPGGGPGRPGGGRPGRGPGRPGGPRPAPQGGAQPQAPKPEPAPTAPATSPTTSPEPEKT